MKAINAIILFLLLSGVASGTPYQVGSFDLVRPDPATWTCYDTAIDYTRVHPDWGVVTVSRNPVFRGQTRLINCKVEGNELVLRDMSHGPVTTYRVRDSELARYCYEYDYTYYRFWEANETPLRNYRVLKDNLEQNYKMQAD